MIPIAVKAFLLLHFAHSLYIFYNTDRRDTSVTKELMQNEYPSFSEIIQFRNQYGIAKNLDIPGIVKPVSLEQYNNGYIRSRDAKFSVCVKKR